MWRDEAEGEADLEAEPELVSHETLSRRSVFLLIPLQAKTWSKPSQMTWNHHLTLKPNF